jgi:hypothetical protein
MTDSKFATKLQKKHLIENIVYRYAAMNTQALSKMGENTTYQT